MIKLWICVALWGTVGVSAFSEVGQDDIQGEYYDDFYTDDLDKYGVLDIDDEGKELPTQDISAAVASDQHENNDNKVDLEIKEFLKETPSTHNDFDDIIDYYQFEDNRSEEEDDTNSALNTKDNDKKPTDDEGSFEVKSEENLSTENNSYADLSEENNADDHFDNSVEASNEEDKSEEHIDSDLGTTLKQFESSSEYSDKILRETEEILKDSDNNIDENIPENDSTSGEMTEKQSEFIEETKRILEETTDNFEEENLSEVATTQIHNVEDITSNEDTNKEPKIDTDNHQMTTSSNTNEDDIDDKSLDSMIAHLEDLNDAFGKVYDDDNSSTKANSLEGMEYEEIDDDDLEKIFNSKEDNKSADDSDVVVHEVEKLEFKGNEPILYLNDALLANESENSSEINVGATLTSERMETVTENKIESGPIEDDYDTKNLTDSEYDKAMEKFKQEHKLSLDSKNSDAKEPIGVRLSIDKPTVVTSPNYPAAYPTNSITEWVFTGEGTGIELNVTDFEVNGHVGHFLLVQPGGVDGTRKDGLVFSYSLARERRYRFFDVDRMYMRFEAGLGFPFRRGFNMSARMIMAIPTLADDGVNIEPKPLPTPNHTLTINVGGVTLEEFLKVEEQFRVIIADMAAMYIEANHIKPGLNTTMEITQILSRALCYHNWPKFEQCAEVRFGVGLKYDDRDKEPRLNETDLLDMWTTYSQKDPFTERLTKLGITEYQVPNDRGVLTVWLVIAGGVVISMAMLAFALWRFSCFEDYTRMKSFSDTDSVNDKSKLDLFPTPHQTLPPLYSEADYKWADAAYDDCKVEVGGGGAFANRSYLQDDMFLDDSDEDVVPSRNRYTTDV